MTNYIYVNPAHGNEPFILGALIADRIRTNETIVMPHLYGQRQERILKEEGVSGEVILDSNLAEIVRPLVFSGGDFHSHLSALVEKRECVEQEVRRYLGNKYGLPDVEINTGSRFSAGHNVYYAFPYLFSELMGYLQEEGHNFNDDHIRKAEEDALRWESNFDIVFIPGYHTFSFNTRRTPGRREISTPPLKPILVAPNRVIPPNSVYCMLSGTDSEIETMLDVARSKGTNETVYVPPWVPVEGLLMERPDVIAHPNVNLVIGRAGWGVIWMCQATNTPFQHLAYSEGDDPEIMFNVRTLDALPVMDVTRKQREEFEDMDGIDFIARRILEHLK